MLTKEDGYPVDHYIQPNRKGVAVMRGKEKKRKKLQYVDSRRSDKDKL